MSSESARVPDDARERVRFYLLDHRTPLGKAIDIGLLALNLVFIAVFVAQTYPLDPATRARLWDLEVVIAGVFVVEYVLRLYGARDRLSEATDPYTVVDLLSVLPTVLVILYPAPAVVLNVGFLRVLRVIRVLRFYRFTRDEEFFFGSVSGGALRATKLLLTVLVVLFLSAGLFYTVEHRANPNVEHFGDAFYYVVVTLSTVGFGDIIPVTRAGRWVTVTSVLAAIIVIPWQASKIVRAWTSDDKVPTTCPDCGLTGHDPDASHCKACGHVIYQEYESDE
ncbi:ion transporter [Halosimplex pelagicum]|uniref:Ion transporter n=1 Tax=Halosimplex pelagicum TaxID=869886 RepID=A0A7D5TDS0_9EURY|nr:ion transporter [Halosimplex pelagicum]QLH84093.1 ion transporter [Halosimplex pelagicum]